MDQFNFFTAPDPTKGFVNYKSMAESKRLGLAKTMGTGATYLGVDTTNKYMDFNTFGRPSTRLESKKIYNEGLFVADIAHMPTGAGTWPAYWTVGLNGWPGAGEIDILEGINEQTANLGTLHTREDCVLDASAQGGTLKTSHCSNDYTDNWSQWQNQGCSVLMKEPNSYGTAFNRAGGGIYVMDWQAEHIKIWMLTRGTAAATNALSANPDPSSWPKPSFTTEKGTCNISKLFKDHTLVINTSFCGEYAGQDIQWQQTSIYASNPLKYAKCHDYVGAHPEAFIEAYWLINSINVHKRSKNPSYVAPTSSVISSTVSSTTSLASSTSTTSSSASATPTLPAGLATSPDGSCGNKYSCDGYPSLTGYSCCSKYGRCGNSADDCGTGCKGSHSSPGKCTSALPSSTTSASPSATPNPGGLITSPDGSCGNKYTCNQFAGLAYACCNQYGRCGSSASDCASGCKDSHSTPGKCNTPKPSSITTSAQSSATASPYKTSPDGSCGNLYSCNGFASPLGYSCCNKYGRCGNSAADCGVESGCKASHSTPGKCGVAAPATPVTAPPAKAGLVSSPNGSCGNSYACTGYASTLGYSCCSQYGYCGSTTDHCGTGCKKGYGACF